VPTKAKLWSCLDSFSGMKSTKGSQFEIKPAADSYASYGIRCRRLKTVFPIFNLTKHFSFHHFADKFQNRKMRFATQNGISSSLFVRIVSVQQQLYGTTVHVVYMVVVMVVH